MKELKNIIIAHSKRYPDILPCDAVKLIYQNEFGGGHLIKNPQESLERLKREFIIVTGDDSVPLLEDIGNGLSRLNLQAVDINKLSLEQINRIFVKSSACHVGSKERFIEKLNILKECFYEFNFSFSYEELLNYLEDYKLADYKMVSHSKEYSLKYNPHYRVIKKDFI